jgi:hypothetical protein
MLLESCLFCFYFVFCATSFILSLVSLINFDTIPMDQKTSPKVRHQCASRYVVTERAHESHSLCLFYSPTHLFDLFTECIKSARHKQGKSILRATTLVKSETYSKKTEGKHTREATFVSRPFLAAFIKTSLCANMQLWGHPISGRKNSCDESLSPVD